MSFKPYEVLKKDRNQNTTINNKVRVIEKILVLDPVK